MSDERHGYSGCAVEYVHQAPFHRTSSPPIASQSRRVQSLAFDSLLLIHCAVNGPAGVSRSFPAPCSLSLALIIHRRRRPRLPVPSTIEWIISRRSRARDQRQICASVRRPLTVAARPSKCPSRQLDPAASRGRQSESNSRK